jgi:hypothetical protein
MPTFTASEWQGTDASLEISLFEYDFIAKQPAERDREDEWFILYRSYPSGMHEGRNFDTGWARESDLDKLINGEDWMTEHDIESLLEWTGMTKEDWLASSFVHKFSDLFGYYGPENIMGSSYQPITEADAREIMERPE